MIYLNQFNVRIYQIILKALYCWNRIRYYENLIKYTDDVRFSNEYISEKEALSGYCDEHLI